MARRVQKISVPRKYTKGDFRRDINRRQAQASSANNPTSDAMQVAQVIRVDYEELKVVLQTQTGESFQHVPVPLTFPGAGARHFFGALPSVGDVCLVGFTAQESGTTKTPYILAWLVPGTTAGHDWLPTQPYTPDEADLDHKTQVRYEGLVDRVRHKLRHMEPGNIVASSAQGSDVILNESVTLSNRRGNEFILRDEDQSAILRSLQSIQALAGVRTYSGMIQRTATLLPTQMVSDGLDWSGAQQLDADGNPLAQSELPAQDASGLTLRSLTPATVFQRDDQGNPLVMVSGLDTPLTFPSSLDPYDFLQRGLYITSSGTVLGNPEASAVYGGKPLYRVSVGNTNAVLDDVPALTEHRFEVTHTTRGRLPVTEETDGFDAERLPEAAGTPSEEDPFIQVVYGSVVGKEPYSDAGRRVYGVPLRPVIFEGVERRPAMVSGLNTPMQQHAATLFQVTPPIAPGGDPTFWSVTKEGRVLGSVSGTGLDYSMELALKSGAHIGTGKTVEGKSLVFEADGSISFVSASGDNVGKYGITLEARKGAVRIYGESPRAVGNVSALQSTATGGSNELPAVEIESASSMSLKAAKTLAFSAQTIRWSDSATLNLEAGQLLSQTAGEKVSLATKVYERTIMGQENVNIGGPKDGLPTNLPLRVTSFTGTPATGLPGGVVDKYEVQFGDRLETFLLGNHTTIVQVGNQSYVCNLGTWTAIAGTNSVVVNPTTGITGTATVGNVTINALSGATMLYGAVSATVKSLGPTAIAGSLVTLHAPGKVGGIVSQSDLDPVSGLPLGALGMGSPGHLLAPPI